MKEAVGKALGTRIGDVGWKKSGSSAMIAVVLHWRCAARRRDWRPKGLGEWAISLSHRHSCRGDGRGSGSRWGVLSTIVPADITRDTDDDRRDATRRISDDGDGPKAFASY